MNNSDHRSRWYAAAMGLFLLNGLGYAALASRLPELQAAYDLTDAQLGVARSGFVIGLTATMFVAPQVVRRSRARRAAPITAGVYLAGIGCAGAGPGVWSLAGWLLVAGAANALLDIGQNVIAVRLEKVRMATTPETRANGLLSPLEGFQAIGGVTGAGFGAATAGRIALPVGFAVLAATGAVGAVIVFFLLRRFDTEAASTGAPAPARTDRVRHSPWARLRAAYPPWLRRLTVLSFAALLLEGALMNWVAVLVVGGGGSLTAASLSLAVFVGSLCIGRLGYGPLSRRLDRVLVVRVCGVLLLLGIAGIVLPLGPGSNAALTMVSAAAAGLGLANLHPFCTATVGHAAEAGREETALGRLNRVAYIGIALEGVLIAALTALVGLTAAIGLVGLLALLFVAGAREFSTRPDSIPEPIPIR